MLFIWLVCVMSLVLAELPCEGLCAYSKGYWSTHSKHGDKNQHVPWPNNAEDALICGDARYDWMQINGKAKDAHARLTQQWIAAYNNIQGGRCTHGHYDLIVEMVFAEAEQHVFNCTLASMPDGLLKQDPVYSTLVQLADVLDQFNAYGYSSSHCPDGPPPPQDPDCDDLTCEWVRICKPGSPACHGNQC